MAEAYGGLVGAFGFAVRASRSWLFRTYVVTSAAIGIYLAVLLALAIVSWLATPVPFGARAFLGLVGLLLIVPMVAPVLIAARRHRRGTSPPRADRWLGLAGYTFVVSVGLLLYVADPAPHPVGGVMAPAAAWLDGLPDRYGLIPPVVAAAGITVVVRLTRTDREDD